MTSTLQATLNDTSVTANSDVLKEVLRLRDFKKNRIASSCPKIMDRYAVNSDGADTVASALGGFNNFVGEGSTPNGAWWNLVYCNSQGQALVGGVNALGQVGAYLTTVPGVYQMFLNGIPIRTPGIGAYASTTLMLQALTGVVGAQPAADTFYTIYLKWSTTESIVLSPFIFASGAEYEETGLFGINAMSLIFNIDAGSAARVIRASGDVSISNVQFYGSAFANSRLMVSYITPPLSIPLPALSSVPGLEFPRWTQAGYAAIPAGTSQQLSSQTLVLPYCPDAIIVACKPSFTQSPALAAAPNDYADFYLPLDYATNNPFSLSFDNRPGILSTATHAQLHKMSLAAGLNVDYEQFSGFAYNASNDATVSPVKALTGAPLVLRFGIDIPLAPGVAPGVVSNFVVQYQVTVRNTLTVPVTPVLFTIILGSFFFSTRAGSSRVVRGLTEADVISAPMSPENDTAGMRRMVGHGIFDRLGAMLSKSKSLYTATKPAMSALKDALPEGMVKDLMGKVGYGPAGAGTAGAGRSKKGLAARLM
jgi:hypothetical protein